MNAYMIIFIMSASLVNLGVLAALGVHMRRLFHRKQTDIQILGYMLLILIACVAADILVCILYNPDAARIRALTIFSNSAVMILYLLFVILWTMFIDYRLFHSKYRLKRTNLFRAIPLFGFIAVFLVNIYKPIVFYVSADNHYEHRILWFVYLIVQIGYVIYTAKLLNDEKKQNGGLHFFPIVSFVIPFAVGTILETILPTLNTITTGATVGFLMIYLAMISESTYEDPMTGAYNAFFLERLSEEADTGSYAFFSVIRFDIAGYTDYLNAHTLTESHAIIKETARILRENLPEGCETVYLSDGEFIVITKVKEKHEGAVKMVITKILETGRQRLPAGVSIRGNYVFHREGQTLSHLLPELRNGNSNRPETGENPGTVL